MHATQASSFSKLLQTTYFDASNVIKKPSRSKSLLRLSDRSSSGPIVNHFKVGSLRSSPTGADTLSPKVRRSQSQPRACCNPIKGSQTSLDLSKIPTYTQSMLGVYSDRNRKEGELSTIIDIPNASWKTDKEKVKKGRALVLMSSKGAYG